MRASRLLLAVVVGLLTVLAACGRDPTVRPDVVTGHGGRAQTILVDQGALRAVRAVIRPFLNGKPGRVSSGGGSAADIATTVKYGQRIDLVVLPPGPALDRVRDELLVPPAPIGRLGGTEYWAAAVTARGLPFFTFLTSRNGAKALRASGFA